MINDRTQRPDAAAAWLHLLLLLALISLLEIGTWLGGDDDVLSYLVIARAVYGWLPALAAIAISIQGADSRITRTGLPVAIAAVAIMLLLDVTQSVGVDPTQSFALFPDASIGTTAQASGLASFSWVRTLVSWASGDLPGTALVRTDYDLADPRFRAAYAITESSRLLMVLACVGFVVAAISWVHAHVVFKRSQDARAFYIALAWLVAPVIVGLTRQVVREQHFRVLFRGAALWRPLIPSLLALALGVFLWWYTARYRDVDDA